MKAKHLFYTLFIFLFSLTSCENEANIDYVPTVLFNFEGGTNLVTTPKGIKEYTVKGSITYSRILPPSLSAQPMLKPVRRYLSSRVPDKHLTNLKVIMIFHIL